ncbi:MAG: hypothetical protein Tsb009_37410 [Planctomycetaceae bacterium]
MPIDKRIQRAATVKERDDATKLPTQSRGERRDFDAKFLSFFNAYIQADDLSSESVLCETFIVIQASGGCEPPGLVDERAIGIRANQADDFSLVFSTINRIQIAATVKM